MKKIAVVLCGAGANDGSEIHEAVSVLLSITKNGAEYQCFAIDDYSADVVNHITGEAMNEKRNMLVESGRIARGNIKDIKELKADDYDAIAFPGGFGAAKNLATYAFDGKDAKIHPEVERVVKDFHSAGKYIGAICIAPMVIARAFKDTDVNPTITLGNVPAAAKDAENFGANHEVREVTECCVDEKNKIVTAPAYMHGAASIWEVYQGIDCAITHLVKNC